jgi:hypothetical protein
MTKLINCNIYQPIIIEAVMHIQKIKENTQGYDKNKKFHSSCFFDAFRVFGGVKSRTCIPCSQLLCWIVRSPWSAILNRRSSPGLLEAFLPTLPDPRWSIPGLPPTDPRATKSKSSSTHVIIASLRNACFVVVPAPRTQYEVNKEHVIIAHTRAEATSENTG